MTLTPALDHTTTQAVATALVEHGLRHIYRDPIEHGGDEYRAIHVHSHHKPGAIDGIVSFTVEDDTRGEAALVTVMVTTTPLGGTR